MKARHIVSLVFFSILMFMAFIAIRLGVFKDVEISEAEFAPMKTLYKEHFGAYHKIVTVLNEVENWAKENNIPCAKSFGEYLDDPKVVEQERLRSRGGCLVEATPSTQLPDDYRLGEVPGGSFIHARFQGSPAIGPYKVYLKVGDIMKERGYLPNGPVVEVYEIHQDQSMTTEYFFPVKKKY